MELQVFFALSDKTPKDFMSIIKLLVLFLKLHCETWCYRVCGWNREAL